MEAMLLFLLVVPLLIVGMIVYGIMLDLGITGGVSLGAMIKGKGQKLREADLDLVKKLLEGELSPEQRSYCINVQAWLWEQDHRLFSKTIRFRPRKVPRLIAPTKPASVAPNAAIRGMVASARSQT